MTRATLKALREQRGMTLIEIMVVIAIIGILSTSIGFGVVNYMKKAKIDATRAHLNKISGAIDLYAAENDYPADIRDLLDTDVPLIKKKDLTDTWKQDFEYRTPASRNPDNAYDLCSKGPDKIGGNDDDICND